MNGKEPLQALLSLLLSDRIALVEANSIARRERRKELFGNQKLQEFEARHANEFGVLPNFFEGDRLLGD